MRRRVPVQNLRGSDPMLLEVQLQDLLRRPMAQLAPINVMDLVALWESETAPKGILKPLAAFVERITRELSDLPEGSSWEAFVAELKDIPSDRVPTHFRGLLAQEIEETGRGHGAELLASWSEVEPLPFTVGSRTARVMRAPVQNKPESLSKRGKAEAKPRGSRGSGSAPPKEKSAPKISRPKILADPEQTKWIVQMCSERLLNKSDGLDQKVLLAGIRHRAKDKYPSLQPQEILAVLKDLEGQGRVRFSAGRWHRAGRW